MSSFHIRPLSPRQQEVACRDLNEDPNRREQDLAHIRQWLKKQPHLNVRSDDQWLLTFLRGCKFSLERTKEKLDSYYTMRTLLPEYFSNRDPMLPEIQELLEMGAFLPLLESDAAGRQVFLSRVGMCPPQLDMVQAAVKLNLMLSDILLLENDDYVISGDVVVVDTGKLTWEHALALTPSFVRTTAVCLSEAYPTRPKGVHYINVHNFVHTMISLVRSVIKEKQNKRLFVYPDVDSMYAQVPQALLPEEYGGDAGTLHALTVHWKKKVESYREWFLEDEKFKSDETKRPGKPKTVETIFGLEGSFRQLAID